MGKKRYFTIILIPHSSERTLSVRIPLYILWAALAALISVLVYSIFMTNSYIGIIDKKENLTAQVRTLQEENMRKESDIKAYESEMQQISEYLDNLKSLEMQVRKKAGLELPVPSRSNIDRVRLLKASNIQNGEDIISELQKTTDEYNNLLAEIKAREKYLRNVPNVYPVRGSITSNYGNRINPITRSRESHPGLDIGADYGDTVRAACDGTVTFAGIKSGYGQTVIIKNGYGFTTLYGHNSKLLVKVGQNVKKGDAIARVGSSGLSTGPHVHFEIYKDGTRTNPLTYLMGGE